MAARYAGFATACHSTLQISTFRNNNVADDQIHEATAVLELLTRGHITYGWVSDFFCETYKYTAAARNLYL